MGAFVATCSLTPRRPYLGVPLTISLDDSLRFILQLVGIVAPVIALVTYRRNVKTKRAEWLSALHAKFFESTNYKSVRHIIDYQPAEFATLRECIPQGWFGPACRIVR